jgi:SAM-dependent methyltransferase
MSDPFAQALYDHHFDELREPLRYRRGERLEEVGIDFYFEAVDLDGSWLASWLDGPVLDMGAGAGRHALALQERYETVAIEQTEQLVDVLRDRGVEDVRLVDMFELRDTFGPDRFESAIALGTQACLSRSVRGLEEFIDDLAHVTTPDGTAVIDGYDPGHEHTREKLDYYEDATEGLAYRILQMEYDGTVGEPWLYRLFTPDRVRDATADTDWAVAEVRYVTDALYQIALEKR